MILDRIVSATWKHFGDFCPSIPKSYMAFDDNTIFVNRPSLGLVDVRIQMIMPSFSTLLATSSG
jgi:hypothetical protein